ncbi:hypothetical protein IWW36_000683 [Coemansia brasiliensis]|uniref:Uncharacterized protein n=1 Tax=Coemansia brasiliensis TaxID=2650707 RepID=A0A9W8IAS5_9FUNG|nr:hypothetical protein IWW36_000683 [Coemansia brasiliensis]
MSNVGPVKATRENLYTADRTALRLNQFDMLNFWFIELYDNRDRLVRDQWVKIMKLRIVREKLEECYHSQSVNHMQNCRALVERYLNDLPKARMGGRPPTL